MVYLAKIQIQSLVTNRYFPHPTRIHPDKKGRYMRPETSGGGDRRIGKERKEMCFSKDCHESSRPVACEIGAGKRGRLRDWTDPETGVRMIVISRISGNDPARRFG
jgi:hypothetical protein